MKAFDRTKRPEQKLPYNLTGADRERALQWLAGWAAAKRRDDDSGSREPGSPSANGNPSAEKQNS